MTNNPPIRELILQILRTRMAFRQALQRVLKQNNVDMTFEMLQVMNCLWMEQGVSQQYLAEKTAKDKACLTNLIKNLEKKKWVVRKDDLTDRRNRRVYLTIQGEKLAEIVKPLIKEIYLQADEQMGSEQIEACRLQLQKLHATLTNI